MTIAEFLLYCGFEQKNNDGFFVRIFEGQAFGYNINAWSIYSIDELIQTTAKEAGCDRLSSYLASKSREIIIDEILAAL